jgi:hypothetical protein
MRIKFNFKILCLLLFSFLYNINTFKPDSKKTEITQNKVKHNSNYRKECTLKEKCRECTFEELKNTLECQSTGYKLIKHCSFYDDKKLVDENYYVEGCIENMRTNPVYIFLIICLFMGFLSFFIRKSHKNLILNQTLEKLTILRKHN